MIYLNDPNLSLEEKGALFSQESESPLPRVLVHVDRAGFDPAVYRKVREQKECTFVSKSVQEVVYDQVSDSIRTLVFDDGAEILKPRYVFDATGPRGLVVGAAGVGMQSISSEQRVVWTHYQCKDNETCPPHWWSRGTNLLRLSKDIDGVDGISWMIPLGNKVSVGCSIEASDSGTEAYDKHQLMDILVAAYDA